MQRFKGEMCSASFEQVEHMELGMVYMEKDPYPGKDSPQLSVSLAPARAAEIHFTQVPA
jgi:hypothetical protein